MDLRTALAEIEVIRGHVARGTQFRGYGPATIAATGVLAFVAALLQERVVKNPSLDSGGYLAIWIGTAALSLLAIGIETVPRTWRVHSAMPRQMIRCAALHFVPPIAAGAGLTVIFLRSVPQAIWMLPGLWQLLFSLGVFSSCQLLPRPVIAVGLWYFATGLICLAGGSAGLALSGWAMAIPFGVGQLLVAAMLQFGYRDTDEDARQEA